MEIHTSEVMTKSEDFQVHMIIKMGHLKYSEIKK